MCHSTPSTVYFGMHKRKHITRAGVRMNQPIVWYYRRCTHECLFAGCGEHLGRRAAGRGGGVCWITRK